ncbi:MAG: hypothetical protein ACFFCS_17200 [Candidatus Hodarchaeota archaeon]
MSEQVRNGIGNPLFLVPSSAIELMRNDGASFHCSFLSRGNGDFHDPLLDLVDLVELENGRDRVK